MVGKEKVVYVGIDPGKSGGIGAIYPDGCAEAWYTPIIQTRKTSPRKKTASGKKYVKVTRVFDEPGMFKLLGRFRKLKREGWTIRVGIERVGAAPRDGRSSAAPDQRSRGPMDRGPTHDQQRAISAGRMEIERSRPTGAQSRLA